MAESAKEIAGDPEEFWGKHLRLCRRSGLSYFEYFRWHDLAENAFSY